MKWKRVFKIIMYVVLVLTIALFALYGYAYYMFKYKFIPEQKYTHAVEYIDPETALLSDGFEVCNENYILQYYNPERATYSKGKNGLRTFILSHYKNENYTDSGYLNIRFVINCKGEAGRYVIHENDLDLHPKTFNKALVDQLFQLTTELKTWNPNYLYDEYRDSYMYISYRIEHGEITEIIP
ncbi:MULTISPECIES: hypothetical protein [Bizionia]|uniref:Uncharacterized protein n=1 Tax=Bizionia algoritergicola TaxID=291187 RepID=A0A5D0R3K4_9FLAO|nr:MULTISPECIES: hypothetical protein [Bizionia]OBX23699.1 hypothetical protein BAA08_03325 [Bizionia sp. APA-3]TYB75421.1 hypothetical protein ES675_04665 [Bizionia algoritergicola]